MGLGRRSLVGLLAVIGAMALPAGALAAGQTLLSDAFTGQTTTAPVVNNGFAHRDPGVGQVGAGVTELPLEPFVAAAQRLASEVTT